MASFSEVADITPRETGIMLLHPLQAAMRRQGCGADDIHTALISVNQCSGANRRLALMSLSGSPILSPVIRLRKMVEGFTVLYDENPETIAAAFEAASKVKHAYNAIDGWSIYKDGRYRAVDDDEIQVYLRRFLNNVRIRKK